MLDRCEQVLSMHPGDFIIQSSKLIVLNSANTIIQHCSIFTKCICTWNAHMHLDTCLRSMHNRTSFLSLKKKIVLAMSVTQRKRPRDRLDCPTCGVNLAKSSYYEHVVTCSSKHPDLEDSDSSFEIPDEGSPITPSLGQ